MVKHCESQRKMYDNMRQQIVNYFCPDLGVEVVDSVLAQIRTKATSGTRTFVPKEIGFRCKCGHNEAWEYPTHSTCKKCARVKDKIHKGKAYRDIKDRGDLNGVGTVHDPKMSHGYNLASEGNMDTKDRHMLSAKAEFDEISTRLYFKNTPKGALQLFARYINSVGKLDNKAAVMAACMFSTLKKPSGKVWTKRFSKGTFNTSKKKRLKIRDKGA